MRVLIVDDDAMVRMVFSGMLQVMKHEFVAVASGAEAIQQVVESRSPFDLILLDEAMPEKSGRETLKELCERGIKVPVIMCSGRNAAIEQFKLSPDCQPVGILTKPFTLRSLQTVLSVVFPD